MIFLFFIFFIERQRQKKRISTMVLISIKWGKKVFQDIELDNVDGDVQTFKAMLYSLTGINLI